MMQPMRQTVMPWCTGRSNRCLPCTAPPLVPFHFHEQDVAATARSLGLPEGTVKARFSRGRDFLESKLRWRR